MRVLHGIESVGLRGVVLCIGNFDGVHRGHQAIIGAARRRADTAGSQVVVMTFDPHPSAILSPDRVPPTLTPVPEKIRCLQKSGADTVVLVRSRPEFFAVSADAFIRDIILRRFHPIAVVEGDSFRFGKGRQGDIDMLRRAGREHGFDVEIVEPIRTALGGHPDTVISSSLVRHLINSGTVDRAAECLGRPYALFGKVGHGAGRGRKLGFPTANLAIASQLIPAEGVYAGRAVVVDEDTLAAAHGSRRVGAALSIGRIPTFDENALTVEAHLLDFDEDLYARTLRVDFLDWLRPQVKYDSVHDLIEQIDRDVADTRRLFDEHGR